LINISIYNNIQNSILSCAVFVTRLQGELIIITKDIE
jgi:hypothetical protein